MLHWRDLNSKSNNHFKKCFGSNIKDLLDKARTTGRKQF